MEEYMEQILENQQTIMNVLYNPESVKLSFKI